MGKSIIRSNHTSIGPSTTAEASPILNPARSTLQSSLTPRATSPPSTDSPTLTDVEHAPAPDGPDFLQRICTRCVGYGKVPRDASGSAVGASTAIAPDPIRLRESPPPAPPRGASPAAASVNTTPVGTCLADQVRRDFPPQPPAAGRISRGPVKKAVVVGINYANTDDPLRYAVRDARRFAKTLIQRGFLEENIKVLTDELDRDQMCPTYSNLTNWIKWLVRDARAGDTLVFFFSGHGFSNTFTAGLVTADRSPFERHLLHQHLVCPVPAGCELQIIIDCCSASAIIHLQYCVGRMIKPVEILLPEPSFVGQTPRASEPASPVDVPTCPDLSPIQRPTLSRSLYGLPSINTVEPSPTSTLPVPDPFIPSNSPALPPRACGGAGIATALPPSSINDNATGTAAFGYLASLVGASQASIGSSAIPTQVATSGCLQRGRQPVVEGVRPPDYFEERKRDFVKPAGRVIFWASTGENQRAYEAYGSQIKDGVKIRVKNGIVAHAMCTVLDACISTTLTVRDIWNSLVGAIEEENGWRDARDTKKLVRPDRGLRIQHAELWVSQPERLSYAAPALDRPMF